MFERYFSVIWRLLQYIDEPNRSACYRLFKEYERSFLLVPGSSHNHQPWKGGYHDHVVEVMNIGLQLYHMMNALRPLPFTLSDLMLCLFLHDIEKLLKWRFDENGNRERALDIPKDERWKYRLRLAREHGIELTPEQENAIRYSEGEPDAEYTSKRRTMNQLAALVHMCDTASARLWHDYPLATRDPWNGAGRFHLDTEE